MRALIASLVVLAFLGALTDARGFGHGFKGHGFSHSGSHERRPGGQMRENPIIKSVNDTVQLIIKARQQDGGTFLWDMLPPLLRYLILNQAKFQSDTWNITALVLDKKCNLTWSELPQDIKTALLDEKTNNVFPSLTFEQLNLVSDPNDPLAKVTLQQLLPKHVVDVLPNITEIIKSINFDTTINAGVLRDSLMLKIPMGSVFFGGFHRSQAKVCMWSLLMGGDNSASFDNLLVSIISNSNLKQMWLNRLLNKVNHHRNRLGHIGDLCYLMNMGKFLSRTF